VTSLFTRILEGELPGRFVWRDARCGAFLTVAPIRPGHVLVVPRAEVDHWIDLDPELAHHLLDVARTLGRAIQHGFRSTKVGLIIAGLEVRHVHLHLVPIDRLEDLDFARQDENARPEDLDRAAETIRDGLRDLGLASAAGAIE
jgi:histidine triad (HIT) family protein